MRFEREARSMARVGLAEHYTWGGWSREVCDEKIVDEATPLFHFCDAATKATPQSQVKNAGKSSAELITEYTRKEGGVLQAAAWGRSLSPRQERP